MPKTSDDLTMVGALDRAASLIRERGDAANALRMEALAIKVRDQELTIAFCGHFSAGKSSLINYLVGVEVLPSSPIPTSANIVTIRRAAQAKAVVHDHSGNVKRWKGDFSSIDLKKLATNGTEVTMIELWSDVDFLPEGVAIMDTPGIDSTDDAHRVATESALYVADAVVYMMDYNHVQSEVNVTFTKMLVDRAKRLYIVVNQIDKHLDFELEFAAFRDSVVRAFELWDVHPEAFFFTSVIELDHPDNELALLRQQLVHLYDQRQVVVSESVQQLADHLVEEHGHWLWNQTALERGELEADIEIICKQLFTVDRVVSASMENNGAVNGHLVGNESDDADGSPRPNFREALLRLQQDLLAALESNQRALDDEEDDVRREVNSVVNNARLILFRTTELAETYIVSMQQGFRVGWLTTKTKTQEERQARLRALYEDVRNQAASNLEWHLRAALLKLAEEREMDSATYRERVAHWRVPWDEQRIHRLVQTSAGASPEYIRNFTRDIEHELKEMYRKSAYDVASELVLRAKSRAKEEMIKVQTQLALVQKGLSVMERLDELDAIRTNSMRELSIW